MEQHFLFISLRILWINQGDKNIHIRYNYINESDKILYLLEVSDNYDENRWNLDKRNMKGRGVMNIKAVCKRKLAGFMTLFMFFCTVVPVNMVSAETPGQKAGSWYWLDPVTGRMAADEWIFDQDNWYYLGADGRMVTGWQQYKEVYYYLSEDGDRYYGRMLRAQTTPDGYYVNEDGVWVP